MVTLPNPDGVYEHSVGEYLGMGQPLGLPDSTKPPGSLSDLGGEIKDSHDHRLYAASVAASDDPSIRSFENDLDNFIVPTSDGSKVTAVDVEIHRKK
ncbi:hypothetical protein [Janibacter anophelis]|uniref:hypothetical protein n=1 Tax=Janibacter anophelis TaxID=319054 RepID=UPI000DEFE0F6|nr:hypothetical protein [Janibacter anophelis]